MTNQQNEMTVEQARRLAREQEEMIKLHTIWLICGRPPLPESVMVQVREWKVSND